MTTHNPFIETSSIIPQGGYNYTYVLNNPLKYTDPSGYQYYWKRFEWENSVTEAIRSSGGGGGGGFGYPNLTQARSYQNWCLRNMGFNPFWSYNENTETYNNRETGGSVNAGGADALDRIGADYTSLSSKGEAYEALGYSRKVLGTDGLGNQEVLYTDPMGKLSVKKEPFWEATDSYFNLLYYYSGLAAYDRKAAFRFAQKYKNGGSPYNEGSAWSITGSFAFVGGFQIEVGKVKDNSGGKKWFFNSGPTLGYDLSFGYQKRYIKGRHRFKVGMYDGFNSSFDVGLAIVDWTLAAGDNVQNAYFSNFGLNYNESGWGISIGTTIGATWQMGKTKFF